MNTEELKAIELVQLRHAIEGAPAPGKIAENLLGWQTPSGLFVCAVCVARIIARGCGTSIPRGSQPSWSETADQIAACCLCKAPTAEQIGAKFAELLLQTLGTRDFVEVKRRNATPKYIGLGACASHDFCDANIVMEEAFNAFGLQANTQDDDHRTEQLWSDAWKAANLRDEAPPAPGLPFVLPLDFERTGHARAILKDATGELIASMATDDQALARAKWIVSALNKERAIEFDHHVIDALDVARQVVEAHKQALGEKYKANALQRLDDALQHIAIVAKTPPAESETERGLRADIAEITEAARRVCDAWEAGTLAAAVEGLTAVARRIGP